MPVLPNRAVREIISGEGGRGKGEGGRGKEEGGRGKGEGGVWRAFNKERTFIIEGRLI